MDNRLPARRARHPAAQRRAVRGGVYRLLVSLAALLGLAGPLAAQSDATSREYRIKAAYLYNFAKYVEWPRPKQATGTAPAFTIGIVGEDPFGATLERVAQTKRLGDRPIRIRKIRTADGYTACQMLFVPRGTSASLVQSVLAKARGAACLIVGEEQDFARSRGIVNFYVENNRVRFEINPAAAKKRDLRISSKLLRLGRIVDGSSPSRN